MRSLAEYHPEADAAIVQRAFEFSRKAHDGQRRVSGEPYITHPVEVTTILAHHRFDASTLSAAMLHDVVEDCAVSENTLREEFGAEIAELVIGVTKLSSITPQTRQETQAENLRRMLVAIARDVRVLVIKLADRLHNMRTIGALEAEKVARLSLETLEIYAPLSNRMGMNSFQIELEDLAFRNLMPDKYEEIESGIQKLLGERKQNMKKTTELVEYRLRDAGITAAVSSRTKEVYSVYKKMVRQGCPVDQVFDLLAMRVLVSAVRDCYASLGIVHTIWKPMPRRFKDYIAMPKPNLYQALHTTVIGPDSAPLEIQIKTQEMHLTAEEGIAAHWKYKSNEPVDEKLGWLKTILDWQRDAVSSKEFMDSLRRDLFTDQVFVITPKGDIIELPAGSTPIDMAFHIHTEVGRRVSGARVDGRLVPITTELRSGQVVQIVTSPSGKPSRDWLDVVKSPRARQKIRYFLKEDGSDELRRHGAKLLQAALDKEHLNLSVAKESQELVEAIGKSVHKEVDVLLEAIGFGTESADVVVRKLFAKDRELPRMKRKAVRTEKGENSVVIDGISDMMVRFSGCCTPVPGDEIIGYLSRGRGVTIHRANCPGLKHIANDAARFVEARWAGSAGPLVAKILIESEDRIGGLADITAAIAKHNGNIVSADIKTEDVARDIFLVEVSDVDHLGRIIREIESLKHIRHVARSGPEPARK